jgi:hypothetical protein
LGIQFWLASNLLQAFIQVRYVEAVETLYKLDTALPVFFRRVRFLKVGGKVAKLNPDFTSGVRATLH